MSSPILFTPLKAGAFTLPNRIVMAPLTRCRSSAGRVPNDLMAAYYRQRASAGLILSEATSVDPMGVGYPDTPGIWSDAQVEGWKKVTRAVHEGELEGHYCQGKLWVRRVDLHDLLGAGHCTYDETDVCCFIPPDACSESNVDPAFFKSLA